MRQFAPLALLTILTSIACSGPSQDAPDEGEEQDLSGCRSLSQALPIPPVLEATSKTADGTTYDLTAKSGHHTFDTCHRDVTYGYNGSYLGPTLRAKRGERLNVNISNALDKNTTVHWHGLKVPEGVDISNVVAPGHTTSVSFTVDQQAATYWYHPHPHMDTGRQVYEGLSGLFLLDDEVSTSLPLPKTYGVDDIPLIVQDRRFDASGKLAFRTFKDDDDGMLGNVIVVNGVSNPYVNVPAGLVRFRLLNGSNARTYQFALDSGQSFYQIASDGGLLAAPVEMKQLMLAPAERAEIVVDFSGQSNKTIQLQSTAFKPVVLPDDAPAGGEGEHAADMSDREEEKDSRPDANDRDRPPLGTAFRILKIKVGKPRSSGTSLPTKLVDMPAVDASVAVNKDKPRHFGLEDTGDMVINGKLYEMGRIDERVRQGDTELWELQNDATDLMHPFHIHAGQFRVLSRSSGAVAAGEQGWKDTVRVDPGETVRVLMKFDNAPGSYLYHCHILEHEDGGMMGTFKIEAPSAR